MGLAPVDPMPGDENNRLLPHLPDDAGFVTDPEVRRSSQVARPGSTSVQTLTNKLALSLTTTEWAELAEVCSFWLVINRGRTNPPPPERIAVCERIVEAVQ